MSELIDRKAVFKKKKIIQTEITEIQKAIFDEEHFNDLIKKSEKKKYLKLYDALKFNPKKYKSYYKTIGFEHPNIQSYPKKLAEKLLDLFKIVDAKHFIVVSHLKMNYLGNRETKFKPLKKAFKKLKKLTGRKSYNEVLKLDRQELIYFLESLFWLTRCDPSIPEYIFIFDEKEKLKINICSYGNVHLSEFKTEKINSEKLKSLGWTIIEGQEFDKFSEAGKIKGRKIQV